MAAAFHFLRGFGFFLLTTHEILVFLENKLVVDVFELKLALISLGLKVLGLFVRPVGRAVLLGIRAVLPVFVDVSGQIHNHIFLFLADFTVPRNVPCVSREFVLATFPHARYFVDVLLPGLFLFGLSLLLDHGGGKVFDESL